MFASSQEESIVSNTREIGQAGRFNWSLLQGATLAKIVIAAVVSLVVIVSVAVAGTIIGVRAQPSPPVANPVYITTPKYTPVTFNPTTNDIAIERGSVRDPSLITLDNVNDPTIGTIEWNSINKTVTYYPKGGFIGLEEFEYTIRNDRRSTQGKIQIKVENTPPIAIDDEFPLIARNQEVELDVVKNDKDEDGDYLEIVEIPQKTDRNLGSIRIENNKIYYLSEGIIDVGSDSFVYKISDGNSTSSARVTLTLGNIPPEANNNRYQFPINTGNSVLEVTENDKDDNDDEIYITRVSPLEFGKFYNEDDDEYVQSYSNHGGKNITYSPNFNFAGFDMFDYSLTDKFVDPSEEASAIVTIEIIDTPPTAKRGNFQMNKTEPELIIPINEMIDDIDLYHSLEVSVGQTRGQVILEKDTRRRSVDYNGNIEYYDDNTWSMKYIPDQGASYTETFDYFVSDGRNNVTEKITVDVLNRAPVSTPKTVQLPRLVVPGCSISPDDYDTYKVTIDLSDHISDPDGDPVRITSLPTLDLTTSLSFEGTMVTIVPRPCVSGSSSQTFIATDVQEDTENSRFTSNTLTIEYVNNPPVCRDTRVELLKNEGARDIIVCVSGDCDSLCSDIDGDDLEIVRVESGSIVSGSVHDDHNVKVKLQKRQSGTDVVRVIVTDGLDQAEALIHIDIPNHPPTASSATIEFYRSSKYPGFIDLTPYLTDQDGDPVELVSIHPISDHVDEGDRSITFEYAKVTAGFETLTAVGVGKSSSRSVEYELKYVVSDLDLVNEEFAESQLTVIVKSRPPKAEDIEIKYVQGTDIVEYDVVANNKATDDDGDDIKVVGVSGAKHLTINYEGSKIIYRPDPEYCENDDLTYKIETVDGTAEAKLSLITEDCSCAAELDVYFVVDRSGSVDDAWDTQIDFAEAVSDALKVRHDLVHIGANTYSTRVKHYIDLSYDRDYINKRWEDLRDFGAEGWTSTGDALYYARKHLEDYGRRNVQKAIILISDGESNWGSKWPDSEADVINSKDGWRLITVAVTEHDFNPRALKRQAYDACHFFESPTFNDLKDLIDQIVSASCRTGDDYVCNKN